MWSQPGGGHQPYNPHHPHAHAQSHNDLLAVAFGGGHAGGADGGGGGGVSYDAANAAEYHAQQAALHAQHAAAMSAFGEAGKDISQGGPKKTDFKAPTYAAGPAKNTGVAADGSSTQRAEAMKAMGLM